MPVDRIVPSGLRTAYVQVEALVSRSPSGFPVQEWCVTQRTWMQKVDLSASEALRADQLSARYDSRFIAPFLRDLDPECVDVPATRRLRYRGRVFDISAASVIGVNEGVELLTLTASTTSGGV